MCFLSVIKRIAPFVLTLTVGLFIASFFVSVTTPNFNFPKRNWRNKHREYDRRIEAENRRLQEENSRLKNRLAEMERQTWTVKPEFEIDAPPPPMPPVKVIPMESVPSKNR